MADDRLLIQPGDRVLLIVEDDEVFAQTMLDMARDRGFRGVVAGTGTEALEHAVTLKPDAITLDLLLPDMDGWVLLDRLKHDADVRHVPVHIISAAGTGEERRGLELGAMAVLTKPLEKEVLEATLGQSKSSGPRVKRCWWWRREKQPRHRR